jgi:ankyrin repeat protein
MRAVAALALAIFSIFASAANAVDIISNNPLYDPVVSGDLAKAERVLATGGSVPDSRLDDSGKTALMLAAAAGNEDMVALLLRYKAKPDYRDTVGNTALCYAALGGHRAAAEELINGGASVDLENRQGMTPLMIAAQQGRVDMTRLLIARGADLTKLDYTGRTALAWAEFNRKGAVAGVLKQAGAK